MENKSQLLRRLLAMLALLLICVGLATGQLVQLQLVHGEEYVKKAANKLTTTSTVSAARGEILDRYGRSLVTNKTAFSLVLIGSTWETEGQFERLLDLANKVKEDGGEIMDILPISQTAPYAYLGEEDSDEMENLRKYIEKSEEKLLINKNATASEFIAAMKSYLEESKAFPKGISEENARTLIGIYYSMRQVGFDTRVNFTMATNISIDLIAVLKENHGQYKGIDIETEAVREYDTTSAAHLLGRVRPMYKDDWEGTIEKPGYQSNPNYNMNDQIGDSGIEKALESYLHGTAGSRTVETDFGGETLTDQTISYAPEPGDNVILTIDLELQKAAEQSLIDNISIYGHGGAVVVIDVHSGEVLAMASYPTYNLETFGKEYDTLKLDSRNPFNNRATSGVYAPGSTFKILTAIAALEEGVADENTTYVCPGYFEYGGQRFDCNNKSGHGPMNITSAIKYSCNVYFYEVGKQLTGEKLEKWCKSFGLGETTGIEVGETLSSQAAGPTTRAKMIENDPSLRPWQGGDDVQAAIGQSDNWFTPLQMANYIAAVVNGGTLYKPTLVKNIKNYDYSDVTKSETPEILGTIDLPEKTRKLVMEGMGEVTAEGGTAASVFADYPIKIGGKTGTAETNDDDKSNGVFVAFAPYDNPEIAICVVGEAAQHGSSVAPVVKDVLEVYFKAEEDTVELVLPENKMIA